MISSLLRDIASRGDNVGLNGLSDLVCCVCCLFHVLLINFVNKVKYVRIESSPVFFRTVNHNQAVVLISDSPPRYRFDKFKLFFFDC
jgi:hypothetical protein